MILANLLWNIQSALNFLDFTTAYVFAHAILKREIKIKSTHVLFCFAYTFGLSPIVYFLRGYIFRLVSILCILLIFKIVTKQRNLGDLVIAFVLYYVILSILKIPTLSLIWLANIKINLELTYNFFIAQCITAILILLLYKKFNLNQWINAVQKSIMLKLILLLSKIMLNIMFSILNFEYDVFYLLFFTLIIITILIPIYPVIVKIYRNKISMITLNDLKNGLLSINTIIPGIVDIKAMQRYVKNTVEYLDLSVNPHYDNKLEEELEHKNLMTVYVSEFIQYKINESQKKVEFFLNILYKRDYENVDFILMIKWLGILIDNAIKTTNDSSPIKVSIKVSYSYLYIRIESKYSNTYIGKSAKAMLKRNYYAKKDEKCNLDLYDLNQQVIKKGGVVKLKKYYEKNYNCNYLKISIIFGKK